MKGVVRSQLVRCPLFCKGGHMKRFILASLFLFAFSAMAFAAAPPDSSVGGFFHGTGYISDNLIMSEPLPAGGMSFSGNIEYYSPSNIVSADNFFGSDDPEWSTLGDAGIDSVSLIVIPLRFAYGITSDISVRAMIPYISATVTPSDNDAVSGSGIGDARIEGLYRFMKESEGMPSISGNLGVKLATGTHDYDKLLSDQVLATGTGGTDIYASVIFGKKLGPVEGKALLGYELTGKITDIYGTTGSTWADMDLDPSDPILFSLSVLYPATPDLEIGGELYGSSGGEDIASKGSESMVHSNSNGTLIWLSPYLSYRISPASSIRGVIDYPISVAATKSLVNGGENQTKGFNIIVGMDWTI